MDSTDSRERGNNARTIIALQGQMMTQESQKPKYAIAPAHLGYIRKDMLEPWLDYDKVLNATGPSLHALLYAEVIPTEDETHYQQQNKDTRNKINVFLSKGTIKYQGCGFSGEITGQFDPEELKKFAWGVDAIDQTLEQKIIQDILIKQEYIVKTVRPAAFIPRKQPQFIEVTINTEPPLMLLYIESQLKTSPNGKNLAAKVQEKLLILNDSKRLKEEQDRLKSTPHELQRFEMQLALAHEINEVLNLLQTSWKKVDKTFDSPNLATIEQYSRILRHLQTLWDAAIFHPPIKTVRYYCSSMKDKSDGYKHTECQETDHKEVFIRPAQDYSHRQTAKMIDNNGEVIAVYQLEHKNDKPTDPFISFGLERTINIVRDCPTLT